MCSSLNLCPENLVTSETLSTLTSLIVSTWLWYKSYMCLSLELKVHINQKRGSKDETQLPGSDLGGTDFAALSIGWGKPSHLYLANVGEVIFSLATYIPFDDRFCPSFLPGFAPLSSPITLWVTNSTPSSISVTLPPSPNLPSKVFPVPSADMTSAHGPSTLHPNKLICYSAPSLP